MKRLLIFVVSLAWLSGCVQTTPVPGVARAGDVIVVGLGGIARNSDGATTLKPSDLAITLTDSASTVHSLEPKYIFKAYPDYASFLNTAIQNDFIHSANLTGMVPYDGGWFVMARLMTVGTNDPITNLALGPATVAVNSPSSKLTNINDGSEGNLASLPLEIIAGSTPFNENYERQFIAYQHGGNSFVVQPDGLDQGTVVGGGFFVIDYIDDSVFAKNPAVVPSDHNPYVQLNYNVVPNGNGTGSIYVTLLNPAGFKDKATLTNPSTLDPKVSPHSNLDFQLMYYGFTPAEAKANFSINTAESYYIGMDGATLGGVSPVMAHYEDL
jgi:hypothetical protein